MASKKSKKSPGQRTGNKKERSPARWRKYIAPVVTGLTLMLIAYVFYLDINVRSQFEGKRWAVPASVYARPLELYPGMRLTRKQLLDELQALGYQQGTSADGVGSFKVHGRHVTLVTRPFRFWDGEELSQRIELSFDSSALARIRDAATNRHLPLYAWSRS